MTAGQEVVGPVGPMPATERDISDELELKEKKYLRGDGVNLEVLKDKKLKGQLAVREKLYGKTAKAAAKAEKWLKTCGEGFLEAEGLEKTYRIKQDEIISEVPLINSRKAFDMILPGQVALFTPVSKTDETIVELKFQPFRLLPWRFSVMIREFLVLDISENNFIKLELGPYTLDYTSSGRYMLVGGRKGHLAMIDMMTMDLVKEFQVGETVRDVTFLQNEQFFAVAQKKYPYMYNRHGTEVHCLKEHGAPLKLQFLNKHFLLASINKFGQLHYQDVSTGEMVANYRTGLGRTDVMQVNPYNSIIGLGHSGGTVTMWKPTSVKPLVKMLCHHGPVTAIAFRNGGHLMATAGTDRKIKLWDIRKFGVIRSYAGLAQSLDFSQKGLLAMGNGSRVHIWSDSGNQNYERYMSHAMVKGYQVRKVSFRPYEDVLGIGHSMGISSILIPGSGEPNFDSWVANPYETRKQRREKEVHALLDKLQPETIMLDPSMIGTVKPSRKKDKPSKEEIEAEKEAAVDAAKNTKLKKKTKGRSKPSKIARKKEEHVFKAKKHFLEQQAEVERPVKKQRIGEVDSAKEKQRIGEIDLPKSLQRFSRKKNIS